MKTDFALNWRYLGAARGLRFLGVFFAVLFGGSLLGERVFGDQTTLHFDSGTKTLFGDFLNGTPLTGGAAASGDGCRFEIGYYDAATAQNKFAGNWIPLTGSQSANKAFQNCSIGDNSGNGAGNGTVGMSFNFVVGDSLTGNDFPVDGQYLAVRFCNATSFGATTKYNVVSSPNWVWKAPSASPLNPVLVLSLDDPALEWMGGLSSGFVTSISRGSATGTVTWATPGSIAWGVPLGAAQLNATANMLGPSVTFQQREPSWKVGRARC